MEEIVKETADKLKNGSVVLYPTDTVWGIGCDATNEEAVKKLINVKGKEAGKGLIVLISDLEQLHDYTTGIPDIAWDIVENSQKPLTVIYPEGRRVASPVLGENGSIAIRWVNDEFCKRVIRKLKRPIVSTSANVSGEPAPDELKKVSEEIKNGVDYIPPYRENEVLNNPPSTIIRLEMDGEIEFIRR